MKRILIDATTVCRQLDGLSQYILNILLNFANEFKDEAKFTLLLRPDECPHSYLVNFERAGFSLIFVNISPIGPKREIQFFLLLQQLRGSYDVFYEPSNQYPLAAKNVVYTVHDLIYERFPSQLGNFSKVKAKWLHFNVSVGLLKSKVVIAVSNFTKSEIARFHSSPRTISDKVVVIHEGWEHLDLAIDENERQEDFSKEYFLYVGSSRGHKNLTRLIEAYSSIYTGIKYDLVIAGNGRWLSATDIRLIQEVNTQEIRIYLTGWIPDKRLHLLFREARALVFPSLCEGFGIPILEAFFNKVPLICSDIPVFREVAGDAALFFDPLRVSSIAEILKKFHDNYDTLSNKLTSRGGERLDQFSWEKASQQIFAILSHACCQSK